MMDRCRTQGSGLGVGLLCAVFCVLCAAFCHGADVTVTWEPNKESDLDHYNIYQAEIQGQKSTAWAKIAEVAAGAETYQATNLPDDKRHCWLVTAVDNAGNASMMSNVAWQEEDQQPPGPVKNVGAQAAIQ